MIKNNNMGNYNGNNFLNNNTNYVNTNGEIKKLPNIYKNNVNYDDYQKNTSFSNNVNFNSNAQIDSSKNKFGMDNFPNNFVSNRIVRNDYENLLSGQNGEKQLDFYTNKLSKLQLNDGSVKAQNFGYYNKRNEFATVYDEKNRKFPTTNGNY